MRATSGHASPGAGGVSASLAGRVRSASPSHNRVGALAIDMRRIANLLRDPPPGGGGGDNSLNTSLCSSPQSVLEPGDRGAAPIGSARNNARNMMVQHQFAVLVEKVSNMIAGLQRQLEADRRRSAQLERRLENRLEERLKDFRDGDGREKWAEIQGIVNGLIEETQSLTCRVEGLDERLWARTSGSELAKQRSREVEQQVQALEQQGRLHAATAEETQKRQAGKLRRTEHALEDAQQRLAKLEEEMRTKLASGQRDTFLEVRIGNLENQQEQLDNDMRTLQVHLSDGLQRNIPQGGESIEEAGAVLEDAIHATERGLGALEKKVSNQMDDLAASIAALRVKVDGQLQRVASLADRMETAHEPAIESLRSEFTQARNQDRREVDSEMASLRNRMQEVTEASDEAVMDVREALRQCAAQIAALGVQPEDSDLFGSLDERLAVQEQEMCDVRARLESMPLVDDVALEAPNDKVREELEEIRHQVEWLQEQGAAGAAAERVDQRHSQNTICELVEGVSRLRQQASSSEAANSALQQQVQQLQGVFEHHWNDASSSSKLPVEVEAKVAEMWEKVAELHARLLEVEGGLDFARESGNAHSAEAEAPSHQGQRGSPPLRHREMDREEDSRHKIGVGKATPSSEKPGRDLKGKLEAIAGHLELVDELADRVLELERQVLSREAGLLCSSPAKTSEVSFGGDAPTKDIAKEKAKEIAGCAPAELRARIAASEQELSALQEGLSSQGLAGQRPEAGAERLSEQVASLADRAREESAGQRLGALEALVRRSGEQTADAREAAERAAAALRKELQQLQGKVALDKGSAIDAVRREVSRLSADLQEAKDSLDSLRESAPRQEASLKDAHEQLRGLRAASPGSGSDEAPARLAARLCKLEEHVAAAGLRAAADDEVVRSHVQEQVKTLEVQIATELSSLSRFQQDLKGARVSIESLATQGEAQQQAEQGHAAALDSLRSKVSGACQRLQVTEDVTSAVKRELEQLKGSRKVGISMVGEGDPGSPLAMVHKRLDTLSEQVTELQQSRGRLGQRLGQDSASPPLRSASPPLSREVSFNFSLVDQADKPPGEGSLNFSLTESRKDLSCSESLVSMTGKRGGDSAASTGEGPSSSGGSPTSSVVDAKSATTSGLFGGECKKVLGSRLGELPKLKTAESQRCGGGGDVLDGLLSGKTGSHSALRDGRGRESKALDSLVGGGGSPGSSLGSRARPSPLKMEPEDRGLLAPVAEETSDVGEQSFESHRSQGRRRSMGANGRSPQGASQDSPSGSIGSLDNSRGNLEVSASCQEVSISHDYSVEDSQELDKCDFVEVVKPQPAPKAQEGKTAAAEAFGISASKLGSSDALDSLVMRPNHSLETEVKGTARLTRDTPVPKAATRAKQEEDNEYGDESFEDNASESIAESVASSCKSSVSGRGPWDDGEDV